MNARYIYLALCILIISILLYRLSIHKKLLYTESFENEHKMRVIPDIIGGIGNQLFVIAAAYALAKRNDYSLVLDYREKITSYGAPRGNYYKTIFHNLPVDKTITKDILDDSNITYKLEESGYKKPIHSLLQGKQNIYLTGGYYQEYNYFNEYRNELLALFSEPSNITQEINKFLESNHLQGKSLIGLHFRLDDLYTPVDQDKRVYDDDEYDRIVVDLVNYSPDSIFLVFSNDITRAKDIINKRLTSNAKDTINQRLVYVSLPDYVELYLIARCDEYIASPSTFNWWGIYLNPKSTSTKIHLYWKLDSDYRRDFFEKYKLFPNCINETYPVTCVSGFWKVSNKHNNKYDNWFKNTLAINAPYIFFCDESLKDMIFSFRNTYPTKFINKSITDFSVNALNITNNLDSTHVPSKELGLIWLEKMNLMKEACQMNYYLSAWYMWVDAGICIFRDTKPPATIFPSKETLALLDKTKINYSSSDNEIVDSSIKNWNYTHSVAGSAFIIHKDKINYFCEEFYKYLKQCLKSTQEFQCYSDQIIFSKMLFDHPDWFNKIASGYGNVVMY